MKQKHQVTIKDLAKQLGVAVSTVSRALNDHPNISEETKEQVLKLAKELNYKPNKIALGLKNQSTKTIGVIIPEIVHHFFSSVIAGIEEIAYEHGYTVMFCQSNELVEKEAKDILALLSHRVDGLLISQSKSTIDFTHFDDVLSKNIPIVFFDRAPAEVQVTKIVVNDLIASYEAVIHLIKQNCTKIVHLASELTLGISRERKEGYLEAMNEYGLTNPKVIECKYGSKEDGYLQIEKLIKDEILFDGIFASNDLLAIGAMQALKDHNIKIPQDVAVIGFSNWDFCSLIQPSLTSVNQPGQEMGRIAMQALIEQISNKNYIPQNEIIILKTELVVRESTQR